MNFWRPTWTLWAKSLTFGWPTVSLMWKKTARPTLWQDTMSKSICPDQVSKSFLQIGKKIAKMKTRNFTHVKVLAKPIAAPLWWDFRWNVLCMPWVLKERGGSICNGMGPFLNKCIAICKKCVKQIKPTVLPLRRYIAGSPRDHREAKRARTYFLISVVIVFLTRGLRRGLQLDQRQHGGWRWEAGNVHELENGGREWLGLQHQMVTHRSGH